MYPEELGKFIEDRDFKLGGVDLLKVISLHENPQLTRVYWNPSTFEYFMQDRYGNSYQFEAIPYEEVPKEKKLRK